MKINTGRWVLAGGLLGAVVGGGIALGMLLDVIPSADEAAGPRVMLPPGPPVAGAPPGSPTGVPSMDFDRALYTMQELIRPFTSAGKFREAREIVDLIGDAGTGREEFRDSLLLGIVQSITTMYSVDDLDDVSVVGDETMTASDVDRVFEILDPDDDGVISGAELEQNLASDLLSKGEIAGLKEKDSNGDGRISREEFNPKGMEGGPEGATPRNDPGIDSKGDAHTEEGVSAEDSVDYVKALGIAKQIHNPLIRAEALSLIGQGQLDEKLPEAEATLGQAMEAVRAYRTELGAESRGSWTGNPAIRAVFLVVVPALVMMFLFYILAQGFIALSDLLSRGMAEALDHETMGRAGSTP